MGPYKGLKQLRKIVEDCLKNIMHPVYHIKVCMKYLSVIIVSPRFSYTLTRWWFRRFVFKLGQIGSYASTLGYADSYGEK